jgi:hypothetical protein
MDCQSVNHLEVLAIPGDKRASQFNSSRRDERIESPKSVGFGVGFEQAVRSINAIAA